MSLFVSSLRFRLILIVLLATLPAMALVLYTGMEQRQGAAQYAMEETKRLIKLGALHQAREIDEIHRLLLLMSSLIPSGPEGMESCSAGLSELSRRNPQYLNLGVIGSDGRVACSAHPSGAGMDLSDRDYFQRAIKGGGFSIGSYRTERVSGKTSINFGYPIKDAEGHVRGVAFAALDLAWLNALVNHAKLPQGASLTVVDREGTILARYPSPEAWVGRVVPNTDILRALLKAEDEGVAEGVGIDGTRRLFAYTPLDDPPHSTFLYTGIPTATVYEGANRALLRNLAALALVSMLALAAAHLFGHLFVMRRVDALAAAARQLAAGNLTVRAQTSIGARELAHIGRALDELAESLEQRSIERDQMEAALRQSEAKFRTLVEQIPVATYVAALDARRAFLYVSPQVETLLGFDPEDFDKDPEIWTNRLHPDDRERVLREAARCRDEKDLFVCEYRMLTLFDHVKWIRDEAMIVSSDLGEPLFMQGVLIDVTEQKRAEDELRQAHDELELRVAQRTEELARANEDLRQSAEKLKVFAYSVVHDLKSPAIGAYGLTKLLQKQYEHQLDAKASQYCDQIVKASEHIAELVEKINLFIAAKEAPLRIQPIHIGEILQVLREEFSPKLSLRRIRWTEPESTTEIHADRLSLIRAFRNYIDNALKYGGEQLREIRIGYRQEADQHVFSVTDDGQGMSEADSERVFRMFQRENSSMGIEGSGLGLAIVKEIADRHRGRVWMESGPEGGATFYFSIANDLAPQAENPCGC